jgi:hypothetical protein
MLAHAVMSFSHRYNYTLSPSCVVSSRPVHLLPGRTSHGRISSCLALKVFMWRLYDENRVHPATPIIPPSAHNYWRIDASESPTGRRAPARTWSSPGARAERRIHNVPRVPLVVVLPRPSQYIQVPPHGSYTRPTGSGASAATATRAGARPGWRMRIPPAVVRACQWQPCSMHPRPPQRLQVPARSGECTRVARPVLAPILPTPDRQTGREDNSMQPMESKMTRPRIPPEVALVVARSGVRLSSPSYPI